MAEAGKLLEKEQAKKESEEAELLAVAQVMLEKDVNSSKEFTREDWEKVKRILKDKRGK